MTLATLRAEHAKPCVVQLEDAVFVQHFLLFANAFVPTTYISMAPAV